MSEYKEFFNKHPVFRLDEYFEAIQRNRKTAYNNLMINYISKGKVKSIIRGLYAVVPPGIDPDNFQVDEILIASKLVKNSVLAFHTALEVLGYCHSVLSNYYYYFPYAKRNIKINNTQYTRVKTPKRLQSNSYELQGFQKQMYHGVNITLTNPERTFIDCINRPDYAGGIEEVYRSIEKYPYLDFDRIFKYLALFKSKVLYSRVGFFLEQHQKQFFVDDYILKQIMENIPSSVVYFNNKRKNGKLVKRWNLIVPKTVIEKRWKEFQD